jgi:hypothetical protein
MTDLIVVEASKSETVLALQLKDVYILSNPYFSQQDLCSF